MQQLTSRQREELRAISVEQRFPESRHQARVRNELERKGLIAQRWFEGKRWPALTAAGREVLAESARR